MPIFWKITVVLTQDFCGYSWHTADTPPLERLSILRCAFYGVFRNGGIEFNFWRFIRMLYLVLYGFQGCGEEECIYIYIILNNFLYFYYIIN